MAMPLQAEAADGLGDTLRTYENTPSAKAEIDTAAKKKKTWLTRFLDYFNDANKNKKHKKFDFSVIGGPHYSTNTKLGLGLVASGLYRADPRDSLMAPSNVSLFGDISTVGFYMLGIRGTHLFPQDKQRIDYTFYFYSFPTKFWGIGYANGNNSGNESDMHRWQARANVSYLVRAADNFYIGPTIAYDYIIGKDIERPELLQGMDRRSANYGVGLSLAYDTRDVLTNPHKGVYLSASQIFRPKFLGNDYAFSTTDLRANAYVKIWKGGLLACDLRSTLNFGNPSWGMMALLGSPYTMRGYYEGRYRDKHKAEATLELRQHVWKRNGIVVWAGAGTVFDKFSSIRMERMLPNFGIGYRWEFKKNVNVRLDYGFGKSGQSGFLFNINEAF